MLFLSSSKHSRENLKTDSRYDLKLENSRKSENVKILEQIVSFWSLTKTYSTLKCYGFYV